MQVKPIHGVLLAALMLSPAGVSADASALPGFSAKFVKPPKPGSKPRIDIQIAPRANPAVPPMSSPARPDQASASTPAPRAVAPAGGHSAWFWSALSPALADAGPGRLEPALLQLQKAPAGSGAERPRLQDLQAIASAHGATLLASTVGTRVSPALALAVIHVESSGRVDAVSRAGAQGLMQLMPATAASYGVTDPFDPVQNIRGGIAFLDHLMQVYDSDPLMVLAAYNAGETRVHEAGGVPDLAETRAYVPKVLAAFATARGLCLTPPQLVSDGCVFRVMGQAG